MWGVERSPSRLKPTNEMGHENEIGPGLATRGKSKKEIDYKKKEVKPHTWEGECHDIVTPVKRMEG